MKDSNKFWLYLSITFWLAFINLNAQTLTPATLTQHSINIGSTPYKTGSDILDDGTNTYRVSIYDAFTSGVPSFVYTVNGGSTTQIALPTYSPNVNYYFSDVCLVQDKQSGSSSYGQVVALVAYYIYDPIGLSGSWVLQDFYWDSGTNSFLANSLNLLAFGNPGTDVNIDGGDNGTYAIIYDDGGTAINFVTGAVNNYTSNGQVTIDNWGTPTFSNVYGYYPDLCIQNHNGTYEINLSYINSSFDLEVINYIYSEVSTISISNIITKTMYPNPGNFPSYCSSGFGPPRIACPNYKSGTDPEWTVVVEEAECNRGSFEIDGYNSLIVSGGTPIPLPYINTSVPCTNPVITYDVAGNVWAGWIIDNTSSALTGPNTTFPIVAACNANGTFNNGYYQVGNNPSSPYKSFGAFSIAAKNAADIYTTYFENNSSPKTLLTKWTPSSTFSNFKVSNAATQIILSSLMAGLIPTEYAKNSLTIYLYNTNGQIIINEVGDIYKIQNLLKQELTNAPLSLYLVKLITNDGKVILSDKIICGK